MDTIILAGLGAMTISTLAALTTWQTDRHAARKERSDAAKRAEKANREARKLADTCPHIWDKWEVIAKGPIFNGSSKSASDIPVGHYIRQTRTCDLCGELQAKKVTT